MGEEALCSQGEVIHIAVGTDLEKEMPNLQWVLKNFPVATVVLVHVHVLSKWIPILGTKILASRASEDAVRKHRRKESEKMKQLMLAYMNFYEKNKVQARALVTSSNDVSDGLHYLVTKHQIKRLVLGSRSMLKQEALLSCCEVWLVSNGKHITTSGAQFIPSKVDSEQEEAQQYWSAMSNPWDSAHNLQSSRLPNELEDNILNEVEEIQPATPGISGKTPNNTICAESLRQRLDAKKKEVAELIMIRKQVEEKARLALEKVAIMEQELEMLRVEYSEAKNENLTLKAQQHCTEFSASELIRATNNFHPSQKIGEGGYGPVYRGVLRHTSVAIKRLNPESKQGRSEFEQEVLVLSKKRHPNIIILYGVCSETSSLVYEYLQNGNLDERLSCKHRTPPLSCCDRIRIISEQHSALVFLHSCRPEAIVHADLKLQNILLDANNISRLGDFGTARLIPRGGSDDENISKITNPMGTKGYMDPMFLTDGLLTPQSDVYSFGIIILRMLTGLPALNIRERVEEVLRTGMASQALDSSAGQWPVRPTEKLLQLALRCCSIERSSRPTLLAQEWGILETLRAMEGNRVNCRS